MKLSAINSVKVSPTKSTSFKGYESKVKNDGERIVEFYAPPYDKDKYSVSLQIVPIQQDVNGVWQVASDCIDTEDCVLDEHGNETGKFELPEDTIMSYTAGKNVGAPKAFGYRFLYTSIDEGSEKTALEPGLKTYNGVENKDNSGKIFNVYIDKIGSIKKSGPMYHMLPDSYYNVAWAKNPPKNSEVRNHVNMFGGNIEGMIDQIKAGKLDEYGLLMTTPLFGKDEVSSHGYWPTNPYQISGTKGNLQDFKNLNFELYKRGIQYVADGAFTSQGLLSPLIQHVVKHGKDSQYADFFKIDNGLNSETGTFNLTIPILPDTDEDLENIRYKVVEKGSEKYIQFYDKRLVTQEQVENKNEFIKSYDPELLKKFPNINTHEHSITPYYFNITNEDDKNYYEFILPNQGEKISDFGMQFNNFSVVRKSDARGAKFWDGNLDLIKMNTDNPDVRNYLYNVANYWTKTIANTLLIETALMNEKNSEQVKQIALKNGISESDFEEIQENVESGVYSSEIFDTIKDTDNLVRQEVLKFPLESIEFPPEITAILSSPRMSAKTMDSIDDVKLASYYEDVVCRSVDTILQQLDKELQSIGGESIYEDESDTIFTTYGAVIAKAIIPDIVKYIFSAGILGKENVQFDENGVHIKENNIDLSTLNCASTTPENEEDKILSRLSSNKPLGDDLTKIAKVYTNKFKDVSFDDLQLAQAIIEKSGAGLNWRYDAAKDIADLDAVRGEAGAFDNAFDIAVDFWRNFTEEIKKENPNAYTIGEITGLNEFDGIARNTHYVDSGVAERKFYEKTGITTGSNYSYLYSTYPELIDRSTEKGYQNGKRMDDLKKAYSDFYKAGTLPFINNSHVFTDNHDKPRTMHGFVFNTELLLSDVYCESGKKDLAATRQELGLSPDDDFLSSRGLAGYDLLSRAIKNSDIDDNEKDLLRATLLTMFRGDDSVPEEERKMRSKALGTRPVEVSMELLFDKAGIQDPAKRKELSNKLNGYIFKNAFDKYTTLWRMMVAGAGMPTIFNGDEFGQTGYETPTKNQDLGCRNRVLLERADESDMFSALYKEVRATSNLHKQKGMSAIAGGTTEIAEIREFDTKVEDKDANHSMVAYKYDSDGSEVMSIFYMPPRADEDDLPNSLFTTKTTVAKPSLTLQASGHDGLGGSVDILSTGTKEFKRKKYDQKTGEYQDTKETYIMKNGRLTNSSGKAIVLDTGVNIFYRVK